MLCQSFSHRWALTTEKFLACGAQGCTNMFYEPGYAELSAMKRLQHWNFHRGIFEPQVQYKFKLHTQHFRGVFLTDDSQFNFIAQHDFQITNLPVPVTLIWKCLYDHDKQHEVPVLIPGQKTSQDCCSPERNYYVWISGSILASLCTQNK